MFWKALLCSGEAKRNTGREAAQHSYSETWRAMSFPSGSLTARVEQIQPCKRSSRLLPLCFKSLWGCPICWPKSVAYLLRWRAVLAFSSLFSPSYIQVFLEWDVSEMFITCVKRTLCSAIVSFQEAALKIRAKHLRYFLYWSLQSSPFSSFWKQQ